VSVVETARLRGEPVSAAHAADLAALLADPRVAATLGGLRTRAEADALLEGQIGHWREHGFGYWAWFDRADDAFVGRGGLSRADVGGPAAIEAGWAIVPSRWGRGYATEVGAAAVELAFRGLGAADVVAYALPENLASRRVMEKLGFAYERDVEHAGLPHVLYRLHAPAGAT
jgi:[ribosomal protein S5]-alanine N-acetyltransferase